MRIIYDYHVAAKSAGPATWQLARHSGLLPYMLNIRRLGMTRANGRAPRRRALRHERCAMLTAIRCCHTIFEVNRLLGRHKSLYPLAAHARPYGLDVRQSMAGELCMDGVHKLPNLATLGVQGI